jgi:hypothetical protein
MLKLDELKKTISSGVFLEKISEFFSGGFKWFVFALFFGLSGYCVYLWYAYVFDYQWGEEQRGAYLKTKDKEVTFDRQKFQEIVEREAQRASEYEKKIIVERDIFGIK